MNRRTQDGLLRLAVGIPWLWLAWDTARACIALVASLLVLSPAERTIPTTVFLFAYGLIPAVAMGACASIAFALMWRYPSRNAARSLALATVSVGLAFGGFLLPTLLATVESRVGWSLPSPSDWVEALDVIPSLVTMFLPGWLFWFSASFPSVEGQGVATSGRAHRLQLRLFGSPAVLLMGLVPVGIAVWIPTYGLSFAVILTLGVTIWSLLITSRTAARDRSTDVSTVILSIVAPAIPFLLLPLVDVPDLTPFFAIDVLVLLVAAGLCVAVLGLWLAVFVQGAVGPGVVITRSVWIGIGGAVAVFLFAGLEETFTDIVVSRVGLPGNVGTFLSAGLLAVGYSQLRKWWTRGRE